MDRLVVVGAGDLGGEVARRWVRDGGRAVGITATDRRHPRLRASGVEPTTRPPEKVVESGDRVLVSVAGSQTQADLLEGLSAPVVSRAVLTGTTGYYGSPEGHVDEDTPCGDGGRAEAAARAEAVFRGWVPDGVVVRLGGLYREGRGPLQPLLDRGEPRLGPPDRTLALIHRDDAAAAVLAALRIEAPETVYLAVTPPLPTREDYYRTACSLHGLPEPRFTDPAGRPPARYDVGRLRRDLLPEPDHPDWREAARR